MSEDTIVLPTPLPRMPAPALIPGLVAATVLLAALAGFLYVQGAHRLTSLNGAQDQLLALRTKTTQQQQRIEALEAQIAMQQAELDKGAALPLPVDVTFRVGRPGTGLVARFQNFSNSDLVLAVKPRRTDTGEKADFTLSVPVHALIELGKDEGWAFQTGDTLSVSSGNYQPLSLRAP